MSAVTRHQGIRYARAERFHPPVDVGHDEPVDQLGHPAPACPQLPDPGDDAMGHPYAGTTFDEDCQRLSVTAPADRTPAERLPVMVWIHGGSYVTGGGDLPIYDPAVLVAEQRVVVVTVTYRLGVLGYLGDDEDGRAANLGLLDQLSALRWVQHHIAGYGGDPTAVTVFGQSAGGDAVAHLLASPAGRGLVRRAIVQSAPFGLRRGRSRMTASMARAAGPMDAGTSLTDVLAAQQRAQRGARRRGLPAGMPFGVQYGRAPLPGESEVEGRWRQGAGEVDVLVGLTREETSYFLGDPRLVRVPVLGRWLRRTGVAASTWVVYGRGTRRFARTLSRAGGRAPRYLITWRPAGSRLGAAHTVELPLLFESPAWAGAPVLGGATPEQVHRAGRLVRTAWASFARTGDPGTTTDPEVLLVHR